MSRLPSGTNTEGSTESAVDSQYSCTNLTVHCLAGRQRHGADCAPVVAALRYSGGGEAVHHGGTSWWYSMTVHHGGIACMGYSKAIGALGAQLWHNALNL